MPTTDPQGVAWSVELRSTGRVTLDVKRWRSGVYAFIGLYMTLIAVGLLAFPVGAAGKGIGGFLLLVAVPMTTWSVQVLLRVGSWASPVVVVDADGITVRQGVLRVPWRDLSGAIAYSANHNQWIAVVVSDEFYDRWLASRPRLVRVLGRRGRARAGTTINLPPNLAVDSESFAAWLSVETFDRLRAQA